jgi:small subunit ribosomal protein S5
MSIEEKNEKIEATEESKEKSAEQPATEKPATEKPATEKPATEKPATEKPATEQPAAEQKAAEAKPAAPAAKKRDFKGGPRSRPGRKFDDEKSDGPELIEQVIKIKRVSKVVKGGKNFSFNALVVAGDGKGQVGIGFGKSNEVVGAIVKATKEAKSTFLKVNMKGDTIPHEIEGKFKATTVILKPATAGTGVIAGGPVRAMCDAVGIKNILTKSLGSRNSSNVIKATLNGFLKLKLKRTGASD